MDNSDQVFWMTVMASAVGILGLIIKKISASKCDEISCWGIHIHRRVELETNDAIESQDSKTNL